MKKYGSINFFILFKCLFVFFIFLPHLLFAKSININSSCDLKIAIRTMENGDIFYIKSGIYSGKFIINKSINIIADGCVIFTSNGDDSILTIDAPNVKIDGIFFYNSGKDMSRKQSCVLVNESNCFIINSFFSECGFCIWINGSSYNYIFNNIFIGSFNLVLSDRGNILQLYKTSNTIISNNFIINGRDGIYISNSKEVSINKNMFSNVRFGIHYMFSNKCNVVSNMISDSLIGIAVMYSKYVDLINNFSYKNINHGLFFRDVLYSRILKNKSLNNEDGILLGNSYYNDIINNDIIKNSIGIKVYSGSDENLVYGNNFINNRWQVQFLDNKKIIWNSKFLGNFWSHYVGWDLNMDNIGDKKFYVTNINDWLVYYYPFLKIMFNSPALILLQKVENHFPSFRKYSVVDNYPLMRPIIW